MNGRSTSGLRGFPWRDGSDPATSMAMLASALMIAQMVAAKALRDSVFLSAFPFSALPLMTLSAAVVAIMASFGGARLIAAWTPARLVPVAFLASALLQAGEYSLYATNPQAAAIAIFLHVFALNLMLTSAFWSLMTEHFDPRSAQKAFGRIAGVGTAGGILGGLLAERTAAWGSIPLLILAGALLHFACGITLWRFSRKYQGASQPGPATLKPAAVREALQRSPYLLELAALIIAVSIAAGLIDFLFKSQAAQTIGTGARLTQFFAWFYTVTAVLGVAIQTFATPWILSRLGLAATVRSMPLAVAVGGGGLLLFFGFFGLTLLRGLEVVLRGSMFRSAYELFFTPVAAPEKRAVKGIIDVGSERLGDALGSGLIALLLLAQSGPTAILGAAVVFAGAAVGLARRLEQSYVSALEKSLAHQSHQLDAEPRQHFSETFIIPDADLTVELPEPEADDAALMRHPVVRQLLDLRSSDENRVLHALVRMQAADPLVCPQLIQLLAHDNYAFLAMDKLRCVASRHAGQLADALLNAEESPVIRRRIPLVLAGSQSQVALDALTEALKVTDFQIRFRCAHAMRQLRLDAPGMPFQSERVWSILAAELQVDRPEWEGRRLGDTGDAVERPGDASVEYLFALLRLLLPVEPVSMAYRALSTQDRHLRGTALEYLQTVLPSGTWKQIEGRIADRVVTLPAASRESARG